MPVKPNFFRASTNNDVENKYGYRYGEWLTASLYAKCQFVRVVKEETSCKIEYTYDLPHLGDELLYLTYTVYGDGKVEVDMSYQLLHPILKCLHSAYYSSYIRIWSVSHIMDLVQKKTI